MLSDEDLLALLDNHESDRVERKRNANQADDLKKAICAFANDLPDHRAPGVLFIGVEDNGQCANTQIDDALLLNLAHMRDDGNLLPFPSLTVQKRNLRGCEMAVVEVQPADFPPVRYNGRVWIRVGPRRAIASPDEERRLTEKRRAAVIPFDQQPVAGVTLDELDLNFFKTTYLVNAVSPEAIAENSRPIEQQLSSLRFLTGGVPNVAAVLLFAKDPRRWIPGSYVQFLRLAGNDLDAPIKDQEEISGTMLDILQNLDNKLKANIAIATTIVGSNKEVAIPDYPIAALQQCIRNAIMHRNYEGTNAPVRVTWFDDRIETYSPGGLFGQVSPESFGKGATDYRNSLVAEAMKVLGYVQRFGFGIPIIEKALRENGNPPAKYEFPDNGVLVTIGRRQ
jgi:ATP-dependent DNA helicase RecG